MSNRWYSFSEEELQKIPIREVTDNTERECPICNENTIRTYFHEMNMGRKIGTSYIWCYKCKRCYHFTGGQLSAKYDFDDPFKNKPFGGSFDELNLLWDKGILPQKFKKKSKKN